MITRVAVVLTLTVFAVLSAGCTLEIRNGNQVWACGYSNEIPGATPVPNPMYGCVDTGTRIYW